MARGWMCVALTASWLGLCAHAGAQPQLAPGGLASPPWQPPTHQMMPAMPMMPHPPGAGCPPGAPCPPAEPPCEGPTDNTQFKTPMFHVGFEYLLWYTKRGNLPPLVTTGSLASPIPGGLGQSATRVLLQSSDLENEHLHNGGRITLGVGLDASCEWSLASSAFLLETRTRAATFASSGLPGSQLLTRPFFDIANNIENADPVAVPGVMGGAISVSQSRRFYGGDVALRYQHVSDENCRLHFVGGVKLLWLEESVDFRSLSFDLPGAGVAGNVFNLSESFGVNNRFYGGLIGFEHEFRLGPMFIASAGKISLGVSDVNPNLRAFTSIREPNGNVVSATDRALLVTPNNAGQFSQSKFAFAPEGSLRFGFDFNEYVRVSVGYTYLYLSEVYRAGDLINRRVNIQPVGTPLAFTPTVAPASTVRTAGFQVQGLDVGLRFSF